MPTHKRVRGLITFPTSNFTLIVGERNTTLPLTGNYLPRTLLVLVLVLLLVVVVLVQVNCVEGASSVGGEGSSCCGRGMLGPSVVVRLMMEK